MSENKIAKVPVASHGIHKHSYNYPWLSSINFGDVMPCYYNPLRKGERDNPKAGMYSQLMPIAHNAFATGRYNFKAIFVPYKLVWRPWYAFDQQEDFYSDGTKSRPQRYPYVQNGYFAEQFLKLYGTPDGSQDDYDIVFLEGQEPPYEPNYYHINNAGRRVLRILGALGCTPSWIIFDHRTLNILPLMCYIKAFADYYFPSNYVGSQMWDTLAHYMDRDTIDFTTESSQLLLALEYCSLNYYENSVFDLAWDNPVSPNIANSPSVGIQDISSDADYPMVVTNRNSLVNTPVSDDVLPSNGVAFVGGSKAGNSSTNVSYGVLTKYVLDSLKSLSLWIKRRQLSGARLIDKFLVSRGVSLPNDSARMSYYLGKRDIQIEVSGVENNTDTNLGELAGRGIATSGNEPLSFDCRPDDDGIFFIIVSPLPDANFPVYTDGFCLRKDFLDNYTAEYDKLGVAAVPRSCVHNGMNGVENYMSDTSMDGVFGFLNRYWDEVQERPRLLGDFCLLSRGAEELQAYHTFRIIDRDHGLGQMIHSLGFIRMQDNWQYQRLFYSSQQENLMLFLRWYGDQYKEKLPLGDSYEWDDDELNRKVNVIIGGSQK